MTVSGRFAASTTASMELDVLQGTILNTVPSGAATYEIDIIFANENDGVADDTVSFFAGNQAVCDQAIIPRVKATEGDGYPSDNRALVRVMVTANTKLTLNINVAAGTAANRGISYLVIATPVV